MNTVDNLIGTLTQKLVSGGERSAQKPETGQKDSFQALLEQKRGNEEGCPVEHTGQPVTKEAAEQPAETGEPPEEMPEVSLYYQQLLAAQVLPIAEQKPEMLLPQTPQTAEGTTVQTQVPVQDGQPPQMGAPGQSVQPQQPMQVPDRQAAQPQPPAQVPEQQAVQTQQPTQVQQPTTLTEQPQAIDRPQVETQVPKQTAETSRTQPAQQQTAQAELTRPSSGQKQDGQMQMETKPRQNQSGAELEVLASGGAERLFQVVDTAPVKVGETPVLDSTAADLDTQLAAQVERALAKGSQRIEIKLTPEHLGEITVELTRDSAGNLSVSLNASTERGAALLEKHVSSLESLLAGGSRAPVQVEVQRQPESQHPQQQYQEQQGNGSHQQREQQPQHQRQRSEDFLQQLRLGLTTPDSTAS